MKREITNIDKTKGYVVTIKFTPNFIEKIFGENTHEEKYFSESGYVWYNMKTGERELNTFNYFGETNSTKCLLDSIREKEEHSRIRKKIENLK